MKKTNRFKLYLMKLTNISSHVDIQAAVHNIKNNIYFRGPNVWILVFSIIIASVGLNVNSIPVIIGAMLISPLMGPIFGMGLGLGTNDTFLIKESVKNLLVMIVISIVASCLYFLISPLDLDKPTELLSRTNPTIYDVLIALFGGFAGIFEIARKEKGTVMSGVAIATALMPPLCTAGYGLASGNILYFIGAFYLFFINSAFMILATYFSVRYMKFPSVNFADAKTRKKTKRLMSAVVIILIVPSVLSAISVIRQNNFDIAADNFLKETVSLGENYIYNHDIDHRKGSKLEIFIAGTPLTTEKKEGAVYNEGLSVWLTDYNKSPNRIEFLKFEEGSCLPELVQKNGHIAYSVPCLKTELEGKKVIFGPAVCDEHLTIAFIEEEGIAIEIMELK